MHAAKSAFFLEDGPGECVLRQRRFMFGQVKLTHIALGRGGLIGETRVAFKDKQGAAQQRLGCATSPWSSQVAPSPRQATASSAVWSCS